MYGCLTRGRPFTTFSQRGGRGYPSHMFHPVNVGVLLLLDKSCIIIWYCTSIAYTTQRCIFPVSFPVDLLKSFNSNFTLAVHSPKLNHAKTLFLSHFGEKKVEKGLYRLGFEPAIFQSEGECVNHYTMAP